MKRIKPAPTEEDPNKVYHVSSSRNRSSIQTHGLIPGGDMTQGKDKPKQYGDMNWVFRDRRIANTMSAGNWGQPKYPNDVWEIDAQHYQVEEDPHPGWENKPEVQQSRGVIRGTVDPRHMRRTDGW